MRSDSYIPVPGREDMEADRRRREDYAASRDLLAAEYNESIAKRHDEDKDIRIKCIRCGKEFIRSAGKSNDPLCPDCR